jgi:hypothetical protein
MQRIIVTMLLVLMVQIGLWAQSITEDTRLMSLGSRPSYQMSMRDTDSKTVNKLWNDYCKDKVGAKLKFNKKTKENVAMGVSSGIVPGTTADLYSTITERGEEVLLTIWLDKGSSFVNAKDDQSNANNVMGFLKEFGYEIERNSIQGMLVKEMDKSKELDKRIAKLGKEKDGLYKDIAEWEEKIRKAREAIKENDATQVTTKKEIETQTKAVETVQQKLDRVGKGN